jgi:hypothetical protein
MGYYCREKVGMTVGDPGLRGRLRGVSLSLCPYALKYLLNNVLKSVYYLQWVGHLANRTLSKCSCILIIFRMDSFSSEDVQKSPALVFNGMHFPKFPMYPEKCSASDWAHEKLLFCKVKEYIKKY